MFKLASQSQYLHKRFFSSLKDQFTSYVFRIKDVLSTTLSSASREATNSGRSVQFEDRTRTLSKGHRGLDNRFLQRLQLPETLESQCSDVPGCRTFAFVQKRGQRCPKTAGVAWTAAPMGATWWLVGGTSGAGVLLRRVFPESLTSEAPQPLFRPSNTWMHNERRPWEKCIGRGAVPHRDTPKEAAAKAARAAKAERRAAPPHCQHGRPNPCDPDPDAYMEPECKTAVITGGATGIGLAACTQLLSEGAAQVLIVDKRDKCARAAMRALNSRFGPDRVLFAKADVADPAQLECAFNAAVDRFGRVDILVNNAAIFDDCHWESAVDTNVKAVLYACDLAMQHMSEDEHDCEGGLIVNVAAAAAWDALPSAPIFCATKRAVIGITESFGQMWEATQVRVLSLCPGVTRTPHLRKAGARAHLQAAWAAETRRRLAKGPAPQPVAAAGRALAYLVRYGRPGAHYVVEDSCICEAQVPSRKKCGRHVATFL